MHKITRRLLPLFLANFFVGFMFHYSIIFPFFNSLGFSTSQFAAYAIVTSIVVLLTEIPSGILADRWSRKGMMIVSVIFMIIGVLIIGRAHSFQTVMIGTVVCGVYFGMRSGMVEAMVYDLLLEQNRREEYEKYIGYIRSITSVSLVISSILGAIIASKTNFSMPYYMSAAGLVATLACYVDFKEPQLHREVETVHLIDHIKDLVIALSRQNGMRLLVLASIFVGILFGFMQDVDPLWPLALGLGTVWFGPLNALLLSSVGLSGIIVSKIIRHDYLIKLTAFGMMLGTLGLVMSNIWCVVAGQFTLITCCATLTILLSGRIQDTLPSSQRSGVESAVGTLATISFLLVLPIFSAIAQHSSIFAASIILVVVAIAAFVSVCYCFPSKQKPTTSASNFH